MEVKSSDKAPKPEKHVLALPNHFEEPLVVNTADTVAAPILEVPVNPLCRPRASQ